MNINAQELSIMRKNMKFGEAQPTAVTAAPVTEPPVTKPEAGLNALEMQAKNNIAFQGVKVPATVRKGIGKMMLLAVLAGAAPTVMTSCTEVKQEVKVDMSQITKMYQEMLNLYKQMLEQKAISNETQAEMLKYLQFIYTEVQDGNMTQKEFQKSVYEYMIQDSEMQKLILDQLVENGKSQEEANEWLQDLIDDVRAGQIDYKEAVKELMKILGSIDGTLTDILAEIKGLREDINKNHQEYIALKEEDLEMLAKLFNQGQINQSYLAALTHNTNIANEYLAKIKANTEELKAIFTDKDKYNKFMADLKALMPSDIDYAKFEAMFATYGLKIEDVLNMSSEKLVALLENWMKNDLANETKQNELLDSMNKKLAILENLPDWNFDGVQAAIDSLRAAMQADNKDIMALIKDVIMKMDEVIAKLDTMVENTDVIVKNMNNQQANWDAALKLFGENNQLLKDIKNGQKVTNEQLAGFDKNFDEIAKNQKTQISYLNILINDVAGLRKAVEELELTVNVEGGMTREDLESVLAERDPKMLESFEALIKKYGFDKVPGDVQTIKDLLGDLEDLVANQTDYSEQLGKIIALEGDILNFLKGLDFSDPAALAKLDKIITLLENWKCNCECGTPAEDKNDESIKDLEDMFS